MGLHDLPCARGKCSHCGLLGDAGWADEEILRQLFQIGHRLFRGHQPTQPPACHAEILGKTVDHECAAVDFQHGGDLVVPVGESMVNLVDDQESAPLVHDAGNRGQLAGMHQGAGGIRRRPQQNAAGIVLPGFRDQRLRQLITVVRCYRHQLPFRRKRLEKVPVAGIAGIGHQHAVAGVQQ